MQVNERDFVWLKLDRIEDSIDSKFIRELPDSTQQNPFERLVFGFLTLCIHFNPFDNIYRVEF